MLKCEHKYWSRLEQSRSIPEYTPRFNAFDPFDEDPFSSIDIDFPFWIKPVKAFSSQPAFRVDDPDEFSAATACMALPTCSGMTEPIASTSSLDPRPRPEHVQQQMILAAEIFLNHIGFDNGCFNAEFMWDEARDTLKMVEVNTRISQSHVDMFFKVDGVTNHLVAIQGALGHRPQMPHRKGKYQTAAKCMLRHAGDALVSRVPDANDLRWLKDIAPDSYLNHKLRPGMRLSELPNQDSYMFVYGDLELGAESPEALEELLATCLEILPFEFSPLPEMDPVHVVAVQAAAGDHRPAA